MPARKILSWVAVFFWMALIFHMSSQVAEQSNQLSTGITKVIVEFIEKVVPWAGFDIKIFNNVLRKAAHFLAYLGLGVLVLNALRRSGADGSRGVIAALGICHPLRCF